MPKARGSKVKGVYERPKGSNNWSVRYRVGDRWVRKSFGQNKVAAETYAIKAQGIARSGDGVLPRSAREHVLTFRELREKRKAEKSAITVDVIADEYLKNLQAHPEEYKDQVNPVRAVKQIKAEFGKHPAATLKPHQIDDWFNTVAQERSLKPASVNRLKATFSGIYTRAMSRSTVIYNPVRAVKTREVNNGVIRFLTNVEEQRLRTAIRGHAETKAHLAQYQPRLVEHRLCELDFALYTGCRKSEQYKLRWSDVNFDTREITLRDTKNGQTRLVAITPAVERVLRRLQTLNMPRRSATKYDTPSGTVFAIGDNKKWWAQALKDAKVTSFRWHDLRHTFCSRLAQRGVNLSVIQEAAGHHTIQMTARYSHVDRKSLHKALGVLDEAA